MKNFEYIFMDKEDFDKNGIDNSKFKNLEIISSFRVVASGIKTYCYMETNYDYINPFMVREIQIPIGKIMIVGYYELK